MARINNNFFIQMRNQYGENFLNFIDSRSLYLKAIQIFRQMSRGQIDVVQEGKYFLDERLLQACISAITAKLNMHSISAQGIEALQEKIRLNGGIPDASIIGVGEFHSKSTDGYNLIYNHLMIINQTRDLSVLLTLVANLNKYRDYI